jgi:hypothetical protein
VTRAEADLAAGLGDLVAFGRPFLSNPDLVAKLQSRQGPRPRRTSARPIPRVLRATPTGPLAKSVWADVQRQSRVDCGHDRLAPALRDFAVSGLFGPDVVVGSCLQWPRGVGVRPCSASAGPLCREPRRCLPKRQQPIQPARGLWVWTNLPVVQPAARAELFATARKFGLNRLFQQVQPLLQTHPAEVLDFVRDAKLHGLQVELLLGGHGWTHPDYHKVALDWQQRALALAKTEPGLIVAIHYDIEPHALPTWKRRWPALAKDWLDLVSKLQQAQAGSGVALHMDIPAWYEDIVVLYQGREASCCSTCCSVSMVWR